MSEKSMPSIDHEIPNLQGHAIGIVDSPERCVALMTALSSAGIANSNVTVFEGEEGYEMFDRTMRGFQWGESSQDFMKHALSELLEGHHIIAVKVKNRPEAEMVAAIATQFGGRSIYHFGTLVDTRLTR